MRQQKAKLLLPYSELVGCTDGLIALSGCRQGEIGSALSHRDGRKKAVEIARRYLDLFDRDHFWIELQRHFLPGEEFLIPRLAALANYLGVGCVASNNVHYATPDRPYAAGCLGLHSPSHNPGCIYAACGG